MSDNNAGKPFLNGMRAAGRMKRLKKAGIILFAVSAAAMATVAVFALVSAKSGDGLVFSLDPTAKSAHFGMSVTPPRGGSSEAESKSLLVAEPLGNARQTTHSEIRSYYDKNLDPKAETPKSGSWNYVAEDGYARALFYTFYLTNNSASEAQQFRISCKLTSELVQDPSSVGNRPYDYVRLALFTGYDLEEDDAMLYYANENTKKLGTVDDPSDTRECLADTGKTTEYGQNSSGESVVTEYRYPMYSDTFQGEEIAYCTRFEPGEDKLGLFDVTMDIAPAKSRRITFVTYLEGKDPDGYGNEPSSQKLGFHLQIGL